MYGITKILISVFYKATFALIIVFFWPWLFGLTYIGGYVGVIQTAFASLADIATTVVAESENVAISDINEVSKDIAMANSDINEVSNGIAQAKSVYAGYA